jgi:hypothetical protein
MVDLKLVLAILLLSLSCGMERRRKEREGEKEREREREGRRENPLKGEIPYTDIVSIPSVIPTVPMGG